MNKKVIRKEDNIGIIGGSVGIREVREGVHRTHSRAWNVEEVEVEILQEHHPAGLMAGQLLWLVKVSQVFVVGEQGDGVLGTLEVVAPVVQGVDNSEQLTIINIIVAFCGREGLRQAQG